LIPDFIKAAQRIPHRVFTDRGCTQGTSFAVHFKHNFWRAQHFAQLPYHRALQFRCRNITDSAGIKAVLDGFY
jgi:hypothetical protein